MVWKVVDNFFNFSNGLAYGYNNKKGVDVFALKPKLAMKSGRILEDEDWEVLDDRDPRHGHDHVNEEAVLHDHEGGAEKCSKRTKQVEKDVERNGGAILGSISRTFN